MRYWSLIVSLGILAMATAGQGFAAPAPFAHPPQAQCRVCKSAATWRAQGEIPIPEHGIVYDFSNGIFWQRSYRLIVDFDRAEATTWRMPVDAGRPTKMVLAGRKALSQAELDRLTEVAGAAWNPPIPKTLELPHTDIFEQLVLVDGSVVAEHLEMGGGAAWFVKLRECLSPLVVR